MKNGDVLTVDGVTPSGFVLRAHGTMCGPRSFWICHQETTIWMNAVYRGGNETKRLKLSEQQRAFVKATIAAEALRRMGHV